MMYRNEWKNQLVKDVHRRKAMKYFEYGRMSDSLGYSLITHEF